MAMPCSCYPPSIESLKTGLRLAGIDGLVCSIGPWLVYGNPRRALDLSGNSNDHRAAIGPRPNT